MCSLGIYNETRKVYSVSSPIILECVIYIIETLVWSFKGLERVPRHSVNDTLNNTKKWHSVQQQNSIYRHLHGGIKKVNSLVYVK